MSVPDSVQQWLPRQCRRSFAERLSQFLLMSCLKEISPFSSIRSVGASHHVMVSLHVACRYRHRVSMVSVRVYRLFVLTLVAYVEAVDMCNMLESCGACIQSTLQCNWCSGYSLVSFVAQHAFIAVETGVCSLLNGSLIPA